MHHQHQCLGALTTTITTNKQQRCRAYKQEEGEEEEKNANVCCALYQPMPTNFPTKRIEQLRDNSVVFAIHVSNFHVAMYPRAVTLILVMV